MRSSARSTPSLLRGLLAGGVAVCCWPRARSGPRSATRSAPATTPARRSPTASPRSATSSPRWGPRAERISADWFQVQPGPPDAGSPFALAAHAVLAEADGLAADAATFCSGEDIGIPPEADATIADDDAFAADGSTTGLTNQAGAVATVLREADDRLKAISADWFQGNPGPPTAPEQQALAAVYDAAVAIAFGAATILVQDYVPPSPNCEG